VLLLRRLGPRRAEGSGGRHVRALIGLGMLICRIEGVPPSHTFALPWMLTTIAATVSSAFAAIIVDALTLNSRPTLAFGEEHFRMHIIQLCLHADQTPTCITTQETSPCVGLAGPSDGGTVEQVRSCRGSALAAASLLQTLAM
jgi:hypothetical protein